MGKVRYTIRLYRLHDLDLITFVETHEFNLVKAVYSALSAFSKDEAFVIEIPPRRVEDLPQLKRVYVKALTLDEETDAKAIEIMNKIAPGYRNNFFKNLLRQYLCNPMSEEFLLNQDDANFFYDKFSIFREGRRIAKAGKEKSINRKKRELSKTELNSKNDSMSKDNTRNYKDDALNTDISEEKSSTTNNNNEDLTDMFSDIIS